MSKKERRITDLQFKIGIAVIVLLIIGLFYFGFLEDRLIVKEGDPGEQLLVKDHLSYKTEFCANRLTELAHEVHFLEEKIETEREILGEEQILKEEEQTIIQIEQRELQEVKEEFEKYESMCNQFDENVTDEFCVIFLQEAKDHFELTQKNADESTGLKHVEITIKNLRNAHRIYKGMQEVCNNK